MIHTVIYRSEETASLTREDVRDIVSKSRQKNEALEITGFLICLYGVFVQVLEGPRGKVESLFTTIGRDPRHTNVTLLHRGGVFERAFGEWGMNCGFPSSRGGIDYVVARARFHVRTRDARYVRALLTKAAAASRAKGDGDRLRPDGQEARSASG